MIGAVITALRLPSVSAKVNTIENWLRRGSAKAAAREGEFVRFFQRPFFGSCLAIWRWTARIPYLHLWAGVRATTLIFVCGIAINFILIALYVVVAVAVIVIGFAIFFWILSLSSQGERTEEATSMSSITSPSAPLAVDGLFFPLSTLTAVMPGAARPRVLK
jgi:hypothetical protein